VRPGGVCGRRARERQRARTARPQTVRQGPFGALNT